MTRIHSSLLIVLGLVFSHVSFAQQAPIGQADGGGSATVDRGASSASLSFELPPERHGIPLPVALGFAGGNEVGAGGVGWDMPWYTISQNETFSRQRPRNLFAPSGPLLVAPDDPNRGRATLTLGGSAMVLVPVEGSTKWRSLVGNALVEATKANDVWTVTDGMGRSYRFEHLSALGNPSLWFLTEIRTGHDVQSRVVLDYDVTTASSAGLTAPELTLRSVRYNFDATGSCAKHEARFVYGDAPGHATGSLLAVAVDNGRLRLRTKILRSVSVMARGNGCGTALTTLHRHELRYAPDADTSQPRLVAANLVGREGTAESNVAVPIERLTSLAPSSIPSSENGSEPPRGR